jgi:hypothetical protein
MPGAWFYSDPIDRLHQDQLQFLKAQQFRKPVTRQDVERLAENDLKLGKRYYYEQEIEGDKHGDPTARTMGHHRTDGTPKNSRPLF